MKKRVKKQKRLISKLDFRQIDEKGNDEIVTSENAEELLERKREESQRLIVSFVQSSFVEIGSNRISRLEFVNF